MVYDVRVLGEVFLQAIRVLRSPPSCIGTSFEAAREVRGERWVGTWDAFLFVSLIFDF